ncbi:MAG: hypothetical protein COX51_03200 [Syntrophobacteraceae bacterium CG23_combo_of_CG06-09_8_20_14_all_50_8]|nr:MAG: hypothetical protein COX51_03200 [Syntrophobacteraceae bacterium CG23_combo_of_CG06-09_8_20_14_all_50_8]
MNYFLIETGIRPVGEVWATMMNVGEQDFPEDITNQALTLGKNIVAAVKNKIKTKKVEKQMQAFRKRMQSLVLYRKDEWHYEYKCWQEKK